MAQVRSFQNGSQNVRPHKSEVDCYWQVIQTDTTPLLHLTTFGSDSRQREPKSSQSIQLDEDMARQLVQVIRTVFPDAHRLG